MHPTQSVFERLQDLRLRAHKPQALDHQLLLPSCGSDLMLGMDPEGPQQHRLGTVRDLLSQLGLAQLEKRPIHSLSGGQKQRLAIAGALASDAGPLLPDEPTARLEGSRAVRPRPWIGVVTSPRD